MNKKDFHQTFFFILKIFGPIIWVLSVFVLYQFYMWAVHTLPGWAEGNLRQRVYAYWLPFGAVVILVNLTFQARSLGKPLDRISTKNIMTGLGKALLLAFVLCSVIFLFFQKPNAEGYDMFLDFGVAFISGILPRHKGSFNTMGGFLGAFCAWAAIISINEIFQCFYGYRSAQVGDVFYNTMGAGLGLFLSMKWVWQGATLLADES